MPCAMPLGDMPSCSGPSARRMAGVCARTIQDAARRRHVEPMQTGRMAPVSLRRGHRRADAKIAANAGGILPAAMWVTNACTCVRQQHAQNTIRNHDQQELLVCKTPLIRILKPVAIACKTSCEYASECTETECLSEPGASNFMQKYCCCVFYGHV